MSLNEVSSLAGADQDVPKYENQEKKLFTSEPSNKKSKGKSNRKIMAKRSKKKNRRK